MTDFLSVPPLLSFLFSLYLQLHSHVALHLHPTPPSINFLLSPSLTLDWTSALWSFWSSSAADLVSSLRAAMCRAGRRTLPLVSCSNSRETTELWPCWRAMASGVKPSWRREGKKRQEWMTALEILKFNICPGVWHTNVPLLQCFGSLHFPAGTAPPPGDSPGLPCRVEWSHSVRENTYMHTHRM